MQFIPNGPDIPETLLQAHEEGRVVFFCGAGISYKVGLKDFQWLVDEIYQRCGMMLPKDSVAYKHERYDIILNRYRTYSSKLCFAMEFLNMSSYPVALLRGS